MFKRHQQIPTSSERKSAMENKKNNKASSRIERSVWDSPKPTNLRVKTGVKAGPCIACLGNGGKI
jgi:hypothetical protein